MALPTLNVTPGSGATINTLPNAPATTANSVSVALATDQSAVPVTAASLPLPTGAMPAIGGSVALAAGTNTVGGVTVADPLSGHSANVFQFHNADNVALGGSAYGVNTGGVAQLLNAAGNLDRQREAGIDGVPAQGISSGVTSFAMQFKTSSAGAISAGLQTVTPLAMAGVVGGVNWSIQVGSTLVIDTGTNREVVIVSAITPTSFAAVFGKAHSTTAAPITGFVYNQGRDASGENDGATGSGTAVAAEFEYNAGDPSGGNFDRVRSLNAKGLTTQAITAGGSAASTGVTLASATGLQPGTKVLLYKASAFPASGSFESVNIDLSYSPGSTTVPLASPIVGGVGYDTIGYDAFSALGPQLNGFLPFGIGIEEAAIFDPVSGKYYAERAATQDGMSPQNIIAVSLGLWNGVAMDRLTGSSSRGLDVNIKDASIAVNPTASAVTNRSGYIHGAAASAAVASAGTAGGYAPGDTLTLPTDPTVVTAPVLSVGTTQVVGAPIVTSSGSGGGTGAVTLTGTTGAGLKFTATGTMTSGVLSAVILLTGGSYTANPANLPAEPVTVTGAGAGSATGVQLSIRMGPATFGLVTGGEYSVQPANPIAPAATSGSGTGATVSLSAFTAVSTTVASSNPSRTYLAVRNESATQALGLSLSGAASLSGSLSGGLGTTVLAANGGGYEWGGARVPSNALTLIGQSAFQQFTAWEG